MKMISYKKTGLFIIIIIIFLSCRPQSYQDVSFYSDAFQTDRWYRIYLPKNYNQKKDKRYPVVYYFHGWGGRYKWSRNALEDDINYPENGRKEPPFVMEWKNYVKDHDVIIVTWDGYEPNLNIGSNTREGIRYDNCAPYDYVRAHEKEGHHWGWDYRLYFRDLVKHVDQNFRTIADRDHCGITGLSMGGLTSYYIAGQNKDLVSSVSAFDPADNLPLYGPKGKQAVYPVLEMYRALKGLSVRLTMTDGDWLKYNDWEMKRIFDAADLSYFEFHMADYPDHWAADADKQLDFHMKEFGKHHPIPDTWNHLCPAFPSFEVWDYNINVQRLKPALTILENVYSGYLKVLGRTFIPDGPIVKDEKISISTRDIYAPNNPYQMTTYNLSSGEIKFQNVKASDDGKLTFKLEGGGHLVGINGEESGTGAKLRMVHKHNREYFYFEEGKIYSLDFKLVNVGESEAKNIEITAFSSHPYIEFADHKIEIANVEPGNLISLENQFNFSFTQYNDSSFVGSMLFEVYESGKLSEVQKTMFFLVPKSPYVEEDDIIILDGRTVNNVPIYQQGPGIIQNQEISGGKGNGNGALERGEDALVYIRLPKGMAPNDINTFHRTYLISHLDDPFIRVKQLNYEEKLAQAGATSISTLLSVSNDSPKNHEFAFWFKVESLYNDKEDTTSRATIYAHKYDYRKARLKLE
ncbi:alpha/beta hydrolase [Bacteroidota bacterium]